MVASIVLACRPAFVGFTIKCCAQPALFIKDIKRGPVTIAQGAPIGKIIVEHHRVVQTEFFYFRRDVFSHFFMVKLRGMYSDDLQAPGSRRASMAFSQGKER